MTASLSLPGRLMARLARLLGCTEGQAYTLVIVVSVALATALTGLPPALRDRPLAVAAPAASPGRPLPGASLEEPSAGVVVAPVPAVAAGPLPEPRGAPPAGPAAPVDSTGPEAGTTAIEGPAQPSPRSGSSSAPGDPAAPPADEGGGPPLRVVESGWAVDPLSAPVVAATTPPDGLPVAASGGREQARSFVRLGGRGAELLLPLVAEPSSRSFEESAVISLCPLLEGDWAPGPGQPLEAAPELDPDRCVPGSRQPEGPWLFTVPAGDGGDNGFALVADVGAAPVFRVTFASGRGA